MTTAALARLTAARAAYRAELSPVMSRDTEKRDRLCAEVDAAIAAIAAEHSAAYAVDPVGFGYATTGYPGSASFHANALRWWDMASARDQQSGSWLAASTSRHNRDTYAVQAFELVLRWLASLPLPAVDDCRDLDFSVEAMAPSSSRARAARRAA